MYVFGCIPCVDRQKKKNSVSSHSVHNVETGQKYRRVKNAHLIYLYFFLFLYSSRWRRIDVTVSINHTNIKIV